MNKFLKKFLASMLIAAFLVTAAFPAGLAAAYNGVQSNNTEDKLYVSKTYSGFKLTSKKQVPDIESTAMAFDHVKTGAKLLYIKNSDREKSFGIGFRTPATDNTGANHIIEHSVLCGSEKYPVKSPFLQMMKQSLNTFINALTYPDFTVYPVASKSEKDLKNLMGVYLDAVFSPNMYKEPNIFKQEGWRYELDSKESELKLNGIVYNEMKGAYSSPMEVMQNAINESLFKDTSYRYNSGGDPLEIPNLTREKFLETHSKYYSPSNCYIFLYGDLDIEDTLKFINDNYLSKFEKIKTDSSLSFQNPYIRRVEKTAEYGLSEDSDTKNKTYLALNYVTGKTRDKEQDVAMQFLAYLLVGLDSSPLKKALLESNIAQNISFMYNDFGMQPVFSIIAENTEEGNKEKFKKIINDTLGKIASEGFDRELLKSLVNYYELSMKMSKQSTSKGISYNISAMKGWVYGNDPMAYLETEEIIKKIKSSIDKGYFEKMVKENLINNNHSSLVILKPVKGMEKKISEQLKEKLAAYKSGLKEEEIESLVRETAEFKKWQETPDSKEGLSKIPGLSRSDIDPEAEEIPTSVSEQDGMKIVFNNLFTDGISYVSLYFDASKVPQEKLLYLKLFTDMLGQVDTEKYGYLELNNKIMMNTGGIGFSLVPYGKYKDPSLYNPKVMMITAALDDNLPSALGLANEILTGSVFEDKERFSQVVEKLKTGMENMYTTSPGILASQSLMTNLSENSKYSYAVSGLPYYEFISDIYTGMDKRWSGIVKNLEEVKKLVLDREGLIVGYTGDEKGFNKFKESMGVLLGSIDRHLSPSYTYNFTSLDNKQAFTLPVKTMDVMKGGNYKKSGYEYSGKMRVLEKILNADYMWQQIRVKGGAYGGSMGIGEDGSVVFTSYRDPNLKQTLDAYDSAVEFLRNFNASEEEMTNYIIGTIGGMDWNLDPMTKGVVGTNRYIMGVTQQDIQKERDEVLSVTAQDIRDYAGMIDSILKQNIYSVAGNENVIDENAGLFNNIESIDGR